MNMRERERERERERLECPAQPTYATWLFVRAYPSVHHGSTSANFSPYFPSFAPPFLYFYSLSSLCDVLFSQFISSFQTLTNSSLITQYKNENNNNNNKLEFNYNSIIINNYIHRQNDQPCMHHDSFTQLGLFFNIEINTILNISILLYDLNIIK